MAVFSRTILSRCSRNGCLSSVRRFTDDFSRCYKIGDEAEIRRVISVEDIQAFAHFTGDTNPIHLDDNFAKKTRFGRLVVHGMILNCLISALHGTNLPGPGCMILSQSLKYPSPYNFAGTILFLPITCITGRKIFHQLLNIELTFLPMREDSFSCFLSGGSIVVLHWSAVLYYCFDSTFSEVVLSGETKLLIPRKLEEKN